MSSGNPLTTIDLPGIPKLRSGKVREVFDLGQHLLFVATDRISAFDCILPVGIPSKGKTLNQMSAFWFRRLNGIVLNHFKTDNFEEFPSELVPYREQLQGRSMIVQKLKPILVECVVRGYLSGSAWAEYRKSGSVCGIPLPEGLKESSLLPDPIFTPAAKNDHGHDENITYEQMESMVGSSLADKLRMASLALYQTAIKHASMAGILIADTKFEFGLAHGELILMDECLTPDSSRFWLRSKYEPGRSQPGMDKQYVRDYLLSLDWNRQPPAPALPEEVVRKTSELYQEAFRRITGKNLED